MSDLPQLTVPPANWYPDHSDARILRWWDGQQWTAHTAPAVVPEAAFAPATAAFAPLESGYVPTREPVAYAYSNPVMAPGVNSLATRAMIYSLIGLVINPVGMMSIGGLVLGIRALRRAPQFAPEDARRGQAIAGIVVGAFGILLTVFFIASALQVYSAAHSSR